MPALFALAEQREPRHQREIAARKGSGKQAVGIHAAVCRKGQRVRVCKVLAVCIAEGAEQEHRIVLCGAGACGAKGILADAARQAVGVEPGDIRLGPAGDVGKWMADLAVFKSGLCRLLRAVETDEHGSGFEARRRAVERKAIAGAAENANRGQGLGGELFGCSRDGLGGICIVGGKRGRRQRGDEQEQDEQERNAFFHIQSSLSGSPENRPSYYRMERAGLQTLFGWKISVEFFSRFV